ncbi:MAG: hypothetical protein HN507_05775 [Flavobacteriaceae bacterium]|jgi:hypothetical protein|nr:hypothetical protein [Flavobacteriaceae bacterium]|tara:strand:+ start:1136 stop:1375 length:240 start_codon:yes stop_codon:yes gene_type:complete
MSVYFRPNKSNNIFYFYEDNNTPNKILTISYRLNSDGMIIGKWKKNGSIKQLMGAIKSVTMGNSKILSETEFKNINTIK